MNRPTGKLRLFMFSEDDPENFQTLPPFGKIEIIFKSCVSGFVLST